MRSDKGSKTDRIHSRIYKVKPLRTNKSAHNLLPQSLHNQTKNNTNIFMKPNMIHSNVLLEKANATGAPKSRHEKSSA